MMRPHLKEKDVRIWVDADACPQDIKEILYKTTERLHIPITLVANMKLRVPDMPSVSTIQVPGGADAADAYIVEHLRPGDFVITADIPFAAKAVEKGTLAIDPRGDVYTEENVGERLSLRNFIMEMRANGLVQGGPPPMVAADRRKFAEALDRELARRKNL